MSSALILVIISLYFLLLMGVSHLTSKNKSNETFFSGNRRSPWMVVAIGMIGASLSGVTFVSVPGMVKDINMSYMQTVLGFAFGYIVIAYVLLPIYYRLQLTSIYTYLDKRIGRYSYRTGAAFFILSRTIGSAVRLYLVAVILQNFVFDKWSIPFPITIILILGMIWLYTYRSGIKTIVWTDLLQTVTLITTLLLIVWMVFLKLNLSFDQMVVQVWNSSYSKIFVWDDFFSTQNFFKQFFSGIFISIVMTGLDQDSMQKNLTCKNLKDAQRNMISYGFGFVPINFIFLVLGVLLIMVAQQEGIRLPVNGDDILPMFAATGELGWWVFVFFSIGIIAASFSSADSALTALTTSVCVDLLDVEKNTEEKKIKIRRMVHMAITIVFVLIIMLFRVLNNKSVIDAIYVIASYTYGPLLGLFAFGIFTKKDTWDKAVPYICLLSPLLCWVLQYLSLQLWGYKLGYELLMINGLFTFVGLLIAGKLKRGSY